MRVKLTNRFWDGAVMHEAGEATLADGTKLPKGAVALAEELAADAPELPLESPKKAKALDL